MLRIASQKERIVEYLDFAWILKHPDPLLDSKNFEQLPHFLVAR